MTVLVIIAMLLTLACTLGLPFIFKWVIEYLSLHHPSDAEIAMMLIFMYGMAWFGCECIHTPEDIVDVNE